MDQIVEMLDRLAEYQAQADLLEMDKRRLLDEVKIPAEVLDLQDKANKRRQVLDSGFWTREKEARSIEVSLLDALEKPQMPAEYIAAIDAYNLKRKEIIDQVEADINQDRENNAATKAWIDAELQTKTQAVYTQVAARKADIETEFSEKASGVLDNIAKLTAEIKANVAKFGKTVKGMAYQAVFVKGRVTWNTDMLDGMIVAFPELGKARKEGQPSVTLRKN
jgi:hypothetical protein